MPKAPPKKAVKKPILKPEPVPQEEDELREEDMIDELSEADMIDELEDETEERIDPKSLKASDYAKIKDLAVGMHDVHLVATVDFVGEKRTSHSGYSHADTFLPVILKDETGEVKCTVWNDDITSVKRGKKIRVLGGYVTSYNGELQFNANRHQGIEFLD